MKISFAVTAYQETTRGGPSILKCIEAAVRHRDIAEITVVDDASEDYDGLKQVLDNVPKVALFQNEQNLGVFGNKLAAVSRATGDWVITADSDNIFTGQLLNRIVAALKDEKTWYSPCFAKPKFDYRAYVGRWDCSNISELIEAGGMAHCLLNTGNQTVHRQSFMDVFGRYLNQRADLLMPNYLNIPEAKRSDRYWMDVFNACDSLVFNYEWIKSGGTLEVVRGFEYKHFWTGGSDSNYNRAPAEKGQLNEVLLDLLKGMKA